MQDIYPMIYLTLIPPNNIPKMTHPLVSDPIIQTNC